MAGIAPARIVPSGKEQAISQEGEDGGPLQSELAGRPLVSCSP